jgi:hypothetical protein
MYISFSIMTKDTYIQSREKSLMAIGAQSVGKYPHFLCLFISITWIALRDDASVNKPVSSFFTGSISMLRMHIARYSTPTLSVFS